MRNQTLLVLSFCVLSCSRNEAPSTERAKPAAPANASSDLSALRARFVVVDGEGRRFGTIAPGEATSFVTKDRRIAPVFSSDEHDATIALPDTAEGAFELSSGAMSIAVRIEGANSAKAEIAGDGVLYRDALLGGTLVHVPQRVGTEEYLEVLAPPKRSELRYDVTLRGVAGLRLASSVLELLDDTGNPKLRTQAPTLYDAHGEMRRGTIDVEGCEVDRSQALPWGRRPIDPGSHRCTVVARWSDENLAYPLLVDPAWTTTTVLAQKRAKHRAAAITGTSGVAACTSGCVLVTGGMDKTTALSSCELFNYGTKTWAAAADMPLMSDQPTKQTRHSHVAIDTGEGRVVIAGGQYSGGATSVTKSSFIYSAAANSWTALPDLGVARSQLAGAMTLNGATRQIVVTGGTTNGAGGSPAVDVLSFPALTWLTVALPLKTGRFAHGMAGFVYGGSAWYVVGGGGPTPEASVEVTTGGSLTGSGTWTQLAVGLSSGRKGVAVAAVSDGVLFGGGVTSTGAYAINVDKFLFSTQSMVTFTTTLSTARGYAGGVTVGSAPVRALFAGGEVGISPFAGSNRSDVIASDGTILSGDMVNARDQHQASPLPGGAALISGGYLSYDTSTGTVVYPANEEIYKPLANGATCSADFDCDSQHCVDGVCCNTSCTGQCQACNLAGKLGTCSTVTSGNAIAPRPSCSGYGGTCGSSCDGTYPDKCHYATSSVVCGSASCTSGTATLVTHCDGSGGCTPASTVSCTPYKCGATACLTSCATAGDCASGYTCDFTAGPTLNKCIPTKGPGSTCGTTADCNSGLTCVDNVCCSSTSCPAGQKCNVAPSAGTCKLPYGATCSAATASQCATGNCVDGVCCDTACTGQCEACDGPTKGTCSGIVGAPHGTRTACGGSGACKAQCDGFTRTSCGPYPGTGVLCSAASCTSGSAVTASTCDGFGACKPVTPTSCSPYVCGATACKTSCSTTADCATGYFCSGTSCVSTGAAGTSCTANSQCASGHCVDGACCTVASCTAPLKCDAKGDGTCSKPLGASCSADGECGKGHCVDGVCCDTACNGQCEACDVSGSVGTCSSVLSGAPHGSRPACTGSGTCQAKCDGSSRTACGAPPGTSTVCAAASCTGSSYTATSFCDGIGSCALASAASCGAYKCGGTTCKSGCTTTTDCNDGYVCKAGVCVTTGAPGTVCTDDAECTSKHCVDGGGSTRVCCDEASCPTGSVCGAAPGASAGKCVKTNGQACTGASECGSGFCVDAVCCDALCNNQCEACDVPGAVGKCSGVVGAPHGMREKCSDGGGDVCKALECDGAKDRTKCAAFAGGLDTECSKATCSGGTATSAGTCDGMGACKPGSTTACGAFTCGDTACKTTCTSDTDCSTGYGCDVGSGKCQPQTSVCSADGMQSVPADKTQAAKDCAPYRCDPSTGNCYATCTSTEQCASDKACNAGACVSAAGTTDDGGCALGPSPGRAGARLGLFAIALVGLSLGRRRLRA